MKKPRPLDFHPFTDIDRALYPKAHRFDFGTSREAPPFAAEIEVDLCVGAAVLEPRGLCIFWWPPAPATEPLVAWFPGERALRAVGALRSATSANLFADLGAEDRAPFCYSDDPDDEHEEGDDDHG